ncbi:MAG: regulatory protein RecX [Lapillicoccus sp.]
MASAHTHGADAAADQRTRLVAAAQALAAAERHATEVGDAGTCAPTSTRSSAPRNTDAVSLNTDGASQSAQGPAPARGNGSASGRPDWPRPPDPTIEDREPNPEDVARAIVLKQLSTAPRSRQQLSDKLRQRGCPEDAASRVLDRMEAVGLVDDEAYAQMVVRSKQATRGLAKRALAHELRGKGVADRTIAEAVGSIDTESERALAEQVAGKTMRRLAGLDPQIQARRLAGVLGRKGYPPSVVYAVVRAAVNDAPEHQRD